MEWQPIKTAPKDKTWILVCGGSASDGDENYHWSWNDTIKQIEQDAAIAAINARPVVARWEDENANYRGGAWAYAAWDSAWRSFYENPTHWMPLPAPPETTR